LGLQGNATESVYGPWPIFVTAIYAAILGGAGQRNYGLGVNPNLTVQGSYLPFHDARFDGQQNQLHPTYQNGDAGQTTGWNATTTANQLNTRVAKYLLQPRAAGAPDLGPQFETSLRSGSYGNLLMALYFGAYPATSTVDLTACAISGQATIRYLADWRNIFVSTIAAGTLSDTATFQPGGAAYYICSTNAVAEYSPTLISTLLADVPNATKILVRYAYQPYLLPVRFDNVVDCGTGTCTLPVDRSLGSVYYVWQYLDGNGKVLTMREADPLAAIKQ
jgi:hypothetical protein